MKQIAIPTDFSANALHAMTFGLHLAYEYKASVVLFHAVNIPHTRSQLLTPISEELLKVAMAELQKLVLAVKTNSVFHTLTISAEVRVGDLITSLRDFVQERGIDIVVMGTRGATGLKEVLIGSNTANAVQHVFCPVLAIPEKYTFKVPKKFLLAYDLLDRSDDKELTFISKLVARFQGDLTIVHVESPENEIDPHVKAQKRLSESLKSVSHTFVQTVEPDVEQGILKTIEELQPDWLIMIPREHSFLNRLINKGVTTKLVYHTSIPLLSVHF